MALSESSLSSQIITEVNNAGFDTNNQHSSFKIMADAIAKAVISEIKTNGDVNTTVTGTTPSGGPLQNGKGTGKMT